MPPEIEVRHRLPGRARLLCPALKNDGAGLGRLAEELRGCPAVMQVDGNPVLGTLLLRHRGELDTVLAWAGEHGLVRVIAASPADVNQRLRGGLERVARGLTAVSGQPLAPREWLTLGLIGLAIHQAVEGNIMVPAVSLLWYALSNARDGGAGGE